MHLEMRRLVGGPSGLRLAIVPGLARLAIEVRRRIVAALLDRLLPQRLRAVRSARLALLWRLLLVLLHGTVLFALVSSASCPGPRPRSRLLSQRLLHLALHLELVRLDLLLLTLTPRLRLAHLALQLLTIRLLRRAVGSLALASEILHVQRQRSHVGWPELPTRRRQEGRPGSHQTTQIPVAVASHAFQIRSSALELRALLLSICAPRRGSRVSRCSCVLPPQGLSARGTSVVVVSPDVCRRSMSRSRPPTFAGAALHPSREPSLVRSASHSTDES